MGVAVEAATPPGETGASHAGVREGLYKSVDYKGAKHAFFNGQQEGRHPPEAARPAWRESLAWLDQHLIG